MRRERIRRTPSGSVVAVCGGAASGAAAPMDDRISLQIALLLSLADRPGVGYVLLLFSSKAALHCPPPVDRALRVAPVSRAAQPDRRPVGLSVGMRWDA